MTSSLRHVTVINTRLGTILGAHENATHTFRVAAAKKEIKYEGMISKIQFRSHERFLKLRAYIFYYLCLTIILMK